MKNVFSWGEIAEALAFIEGKLLPAVARRYAVVLL